jgi:dTDP-glucose 4,6-dehydratase
MLAKYQEYQIINLDKLTYAGNVENLKDMNNRKNYVFIHGDIADKDLVQDIFSGRYRVNHKNISAPNMVVNFAAESHVDRSIFGPEAFIQTNIFGTFCLLEAARENWPLRSGKIETGQSSPGRTSERELTSSSVRYRFLHVSTDEVYGSLGAEGYFTEASPYDPSSPYSASKAAADHLVSAYYRTYDMPTLISNCSNNYGPYQFPEKLIPLLILNAMEGKQLPIYGEGQNVRDWLYVLDHCEALDLVLHKGKTGETYNIGADNEWKNIDLVKLICEILGRKLNKQEELESLITFVPDRPGHDERYAIDSSKLQSNLGWRPRYGFEETLEATIDWYLDHMDWVQSVKTGEYRKWIELNYGEHSRGLRAKD